MKKILLIFFLYNLLPKITFSAELFFEKFISSHITVNNKKYPYYIVIDEENNFKEIFIESKDWADKIYGYGGPINLQIYFSLDGFIKRINVLEHYETKAFAEEVFSEKFLSQYYNKNSGFIIGKDIKAITGATISCRAVNEIISQCVERTNRYLFNNQNLFKVPPKFSSSDFLKVGILLILFILSVIGYIFDLYVLRIAIMIISIAFLGIFYFGGLSFSHIRSLVFLNFLPFENLFFWVLILLVLISLVLFGRLYCGWLCPFGALIELLYRIKKFLEVRYKKSLGKEIEIEFIDDNFIVKFLRKFENWYRYIKYILVFVILFFPVFIFLEPFQYVFVFYKSNLRSLIYSILILVGCIIFIRVWCRYFCPLGGFLALSSKISLFRLKISDKDCLHCEICKVSCPMNAIVEKNKKLEIIHSECILCNFCRRVCGPKVINVDFLIKAKNHRLK